MSDAAIELRGVTKRFRGQTILSDLNLTLPAEQALVFLGRNGAGKTTTIRMLLGLLKPDQGQVRVLGLDPWRDGLEVRRRVGYVAEDQVMFPAMRVGQLISFMAPFFPTWEAKWASELVNRFELPLKTRVGHLSKGQSVRLALLLALAHNPRLLILDDPTLGLDPITRRVFLRDLMMHLYDRKTSIFLSSHLLYEIESVADTIAILDSGRIVRHASPEELKQTVKRIIGPAEKRGALRGLPSVLDAEDAGYETWVTVEDAPTALLAASQKGLHVKTVDLNLDEIFAAYVIGRKNRPSAEPSLERMD